MINVIHRLYYLTVNIRVVRLKRDGRTINITKQIIKKKNNGKTRNLHQRLLR